MRAMLAAMLVALLVAALPVHLGAQAVDSALAAEIASIKAIDNHAHPLLPAPKDSEYDALPLGAIPPFPLPARLRPDALVFRDALATLSRKGVMQTEGLHFDEWVLDQLNTDIMIANRITMGPGLTSPRFRWVPYDDALLFPFNTTAEAARTPDLHSLYPRESALFRRYLRDLGLAHPPPTLDAYLAQVVAPTLDRQRAAGAVAIKFELAYLRPLAIGDPPPSAARAIYARYAHGGTPSHAEYTTLEDFLFREIARQAGARGLAVHIHCIDLAGGYYDVGGSDPLQLESVFNDSTLRATRFVLLHGGWPNVEHTLSMLGKPNVYADFSLMDQILPPATLARVLRLWLDEYPEKVLYGTDAFADSNDDPIGWPESGLVAATTARQALGIALTAMMRDGDITRDRAYAIARLVLRGNAATLYGLATSSR
jgi:uncharacterized protein